MQFEGFQGAGQRIDQPNMADAVAWFIDSLHCSGSCLLRQPFPVFQTTAAELFRQIFQIHQGLRITDSLGNLVGCNKASKRLLMLIFLPIDMAYIEQRWT